MKKLLSLIICLTLLVAAIPAAAEVTIEIDPLRYEEYMRGESIFISGNISEPVTVALCYPQESDYAGMTKWAEAFTPDKFSEGFYLPTGTDELDWPEGYWTIKAETSGYSDTVQFYLTDYVDRPTEPEEDDSDNSHTGSDVPSVTPIIPDKDTVSLKVGETEAIALTTAASSITLEVEDEAVVSATVSNKTVTIKALKRGESAIWLKTGGTHVATIKVTVKPKSTGGGNNGGIITKPKDEPVEEPSTEPSEPVEEPSTEPTEEPSEEPSTEEEPSCPFEDIENHWAKDSILTLYNSGIIKGMSESTFAPDENVTRAQFVTMLCNAFDITTNIYNSPFTDVSEDDWFFMSVMAAYSNEIAKGSVDGSFNPNALVTRQDMAVFAYRAAQNASIKLSISDVNIFSDHSLISDYAVESVYSMRSAGVINGMTKDSFVPMGNATRAQAAHIIAMLLSLK